MSYLVLARKWRPKTFDDVVGQEFITLTLKNSILSNKLAHALIFSGPRGVGKTSTARILAKALNCIKKDGEKLMCIENPCSFCAEISEGTSIDVQEIDAASHTGVNDVREIIENVKYLPSSANMKVYIIDEAHMLSQAAFNALLKTLEEPPGHVLFILATTESHKIPATIQSRCQRYNFKKLSLAEITNKLEQISADESLEIDRETLLTIAREADGSIRDSLSILDQVTATCGSRIEYKRALEVLGLLDKTHLYELLNNIINKNPKSAVEILHNIIKHGVIHKKIADELVNIIRNAVMVKICGKDSSLDLSEDEVKELEDLTANNSVEDLEMLFSLSIENAENIHKSSFQELSLESMVIKLATTRNTVPINEIMGKITSLAKKIGTEPGKPEPANPREERSYTTKQEEKAGNIKKQTEAEALELIAPEPPAEITENNTVDNSESFTVFVKQQNTILGLNLDKAESILDDGPDLKIIFKENNINYEYLRKKNSIVALKSHANNYYGKELNIRIDFNSQEQKIDKKNPGKPSIKDDPSVKDALTIFDGTILKIKAVKEE